jgi:hypothetical protein
MHTAIANAFEAIHEGYNSAKIFNIPSVQIPKINPAVLQNEAKAADDSCRAKPDWHLHL